MVLYPTLPLTCYVTLGKLPSLSVLPFPLMPFARLFYLDWKFFEARIVSYCVCAAPNKMGPQSWLGPTGATVILMIQKSQYSSLIMVLYSHTLIYVMSWLSSLISPPSLEQAYLHYVTYPSKCPLVSITRTSVRGVPASVSLDLPGSFGPWRQPEWSPATVPSSRSLGTHSGCRPAV